MITRLRDILLVAGFDLLDSLRSRKALVLLVLYLAGSVGAALIFLEALSSVEAAAADTLRVAATEQPGTMTEQLMASEQFLDMVTALVRDRELARELVSVPPMALFYGWMSLTFVPILVTLTSADAVSAEVATGSVRFALFRTERVSWAVGKLAGQSALMACGILLGALGVYGVGLVRLAGFQPAESAAWLLAVSGRTWTYGFTWLGLSMGVSQLTRSVSRARGIALIALFGTGMLGGLLRTDRVRDFAPVLVDTLFQLFPQAYRVDLWRPELMDRLPAFVMLLALGGLFFAAGHAVFARRDA